MPVAGSEAEALALLEHAAREELRLGVHYCSSDNKNAGRIYQQNKAFACDDVVHLRYAWLSADAGDRLLKCAKAFWLDVQPVLEWARGEGVSCDVDEGVPGIASPLAWSRRRTKHALAQRWPKVPTYSSVARLTSCICEKSVCEICKWFIPRCELCL